MLGYNVLKPQLRCGRQFNVIRAFNSKSENWNSTRNMKRVSSSNNKHVDELHNLVYSSSIPFVETDTTRTKHKQRNFKSRTKYYSALLNKFPVFLILEEQQPNHHSSNDWISVSREIQKLNHGNNLRLLKLDKEQARFIDPNHMMRLYDDIDLIDVESFNVALNFTSDQIKNAKHMHKELKLNSDEDQFLLKPKQPYKSLAISHLALYVDTTPLFELLERYKDVYKLQVIRIAQYALDQKVIGTNHLNTNKTEIFSYEDLLKYAKDHSRQAEALRENRKKNELTTETNYIDFFTQAGKIGFVNIEKYGNSVYLSK